MTAPACAAQVHDTHTAYVRHGCRCPAACEARLRYDKRLKLEHARGQQRTVDATGTRRRLEALAVLGWSQSAVARRLGLSQQNVNTWTTRRRIRVATAQLVAGLYAELWNTPNPHPMAYVTRGIAERRGYLSPLWWDDDRIDDPTYDPRTDVQPDRITPFRERRNARLGEVARLRTRGFSARAIAEQVGISRRQVERDLAEIRGLQDHAEHVAERVAS